MSCSRSSITAAALAVVLQLSTLPASANAATVRIWPIDPAIEASSKGTVVWLENRGGSDTVLQIRVMRWSQDGGSDVHAEQDEIQASPPMVRIAPGVRQMVRLVDSGRRPRQGEQAYRILVDEVPAVTREQRDTPVASAIRFRMRYSVPLFVAGKDVPAKTQWSSPAAVSLSCTISPDGKAVTVRNHGPIHARLADAAFGPEGSRTPLAQGLLGYVLADSGMTWSAPSDLHADGILQATVNGRKQVTIGACSRE